MESLSLLPLLFGLVLILFGMLIHTFGYYCLFADIFEVGLWWGLGALFVPGFLLVAIIIHRLRVWKSVVTVVSGMAVALVGVLAMHFTT